MNPRKGSEENEELDEEQRERVRRLDEERLKKMTFYCFTSDCLRAYILRYFGETAPDHCGNCGNCLTNFEEQDVTEAAAAILACVRACGQRYGRKTIAAVLLGGEKGKRNETARRHSLDELPQFGSLSAGDHLHCSGGGRHAEAGFGENQQRHSQKGYFCRHASAGQRYPAGPAVY